jgi:hypothetical protein
VNSKQLHARNISGKQLNSEQQTAHPPEIYQVNSSTANSKQLHARSISGKQLNSEKQTAPARNISGEQLNSEQQTPPRKKYIR